MTENRAFLSRPQAVPADAALVACSFYTTELVTQLMLQTASTTINSQALLAQAESMPWWTGAVPARLGRQGLVPWFGHQRTGTVCSIGHPLQAKCS